MAKMIEIVCACGCGRKKMVRTADVARGWGKFFSKSCKAKEQEKRTGQYKTHINGGFTRSARKTKSTKEQRYQHLCESHEEGRISDEYFYHTLQAEYSEFITAEDQWEIYVHTDVHPFSSEGLGQD